MNAEKPDVPTLEIVLKEMNEGLRKRDPNKDITVSMTIRETDVSKLQAWMQGDNFEKAQAIRNADLTECTKSLEHIVKYATFEYGSGATVFAQFLASLYNGNRVKADVSGIRLLDGRNFEHMMNVMRLCFMAGREPHDFFKNGNDIFEFIIKRHKLEKRRKS